MYVTSKFKWKVFYLSMYYSPSSLSSWFFNEVYLLNFLSQLEKNLCSLNPIYNHIEANIIETPIKNKRKTPTSGNLYRILFMKEGWITKTEANIKDKGARINEERIITLKTLLVVFIWDISSSSNSTTLVLECTVSVSFIELSPSLSLLFEDILLNLCDLTPLKILG